MKKTISRILGLVALSFAAQGHAQGVEVGHGTLCDTQTQIERYVEFYNGGKTENEALKAVNALEKQAVCRRLRFVLHSSKKVGEVRMANEGMLDIRHVAVIAVFLDGVSRPLPSAILQFALKKPAGQDI